MISLTGLRPGVPPALLLSLLAFALPGCSESEPPRPYSAPEDARIELRRDIVFLSASGGALKGTGEALQGVAGRTGARKACLVVLALIVCAGLCCLLATPNLIEARKSADMTGGEALPRINLSARLPIAPAAIIEIANCNGHTSFRSLYR